LARDSAAARDWVNQSRIHWDHGDVERALHCCGQALALDPLNVDALANAGTLLWVGGNGEQAQQLYLRAHELDPAHVGVMLNLAALRNDVADLDGACQWLARASARSPDDPEVVWHKSLLELAMGDYANGWKHYEAGLNSQAMRGLGPGFPTAPWNGDRCDRLLIWHEQGFGDTIQFVRYAKLCKERAARVCVLCPRGLVTLLRSCPFVDDATEAVDAGAFDQQISIMSLPYLFGTTLETVPAPHTVPPCGRCSGGQMGVADARRRAQGGPRLGCQFPKKPAEVPWDRPAPQCVAAGDAATIGAAAGRVLQPAERGSGPGSPG
jgi:hypothetical protein